ncbi:hypothetical protein BCR39DRAFT_551744 [Naematelia encephala]|uniref:SET domain-containing protein n=1 Tax=Naematelia encephala TaxID=71784 RepID=A0A1Y2AJA7_9TREE|nr:hypothetical protein BCR39DRAFT_551744 [Naematelia encephala]
MISFSDLKAAREARHHRPITVLDGAETGHASSSTAGSGDPSIAEPSSCACTRAFNLVSNAAFASTSTSASASISTPSSTTPAPPKPTSIDPRDTIYTLPPFLQVRRSEGSGRGIYTTKRIKAGSVLLLSTPRVAVLSTSQLSSTCSGCFLTPQESALKSGQPVQGIKRCQACRATYYCSIACQRNDWKEHKPECQAHKVLRGAWEARHSGENGKLHVGEEKKWVMSEAVRGLGRLIWARKREREVSGKDPDWWAEIEAMESHVETLPVAEVMRFGREIQILRQYLSCADAASGDRPDPADMVDYGFTSSGQLLNLISALTINSFTLSSPSLSPIGLAMSPITALFNHSCRPNAVVVFPNGGGEMNVVAISDIEPGQEILTSYIDVSLPREFRRKELKDRYGFECDCPLCKTGGSELPVGPDVDEGMELLRKEEEGTLDHTDLDTRRRLSSIIIPLTRRLSNSSHPVLALLRLQALVLTPPTSFRSHTLAITSLAQAYSGAQMVYPPGHPTLGMILAEWGKLLAMESPPEWGETNKVEMMRRLEPAVLVLRRAGMMLEMGFGAGGGLVGKEVEGLRRGCEGELQLLRMAQ